MPQTKTQIVEQIAERLGVEPPPMSSGSTEPKRIFELIVEELSLPIDPSKFSKPDLAREIVKRVDLHWSPVTCESSGGTVTRTGLGLVSQALEILIGDSEFHDR